MRLNIIFGGVMAVLIIFVFMRDWRSTLISALALPTSVIATFFFMWMAGFTINMMTLMAVSLVIGILIDDAVVVRENIYRHMEMGKDPMTAAREGTAEIGLAVMATTFTILAVFLPVGFMTGIVGQFFKSFALTVAFAVAMSLLVAFTLDPMLSSRFVRYIPPEERLRSRTGRILERWGRAYDRLDGRYHRILEWALRHPWKVVASAVAIFVVSMSSITIIGTEFVPPEDRGEFQVIVDLPPGVSFDESVREIAKVEREVLATPEVRQVFSTVGVQGEIRKSTLRVQTSRKDERERGLIEIKADLRRRLATMPFIETKVADPEFMQGAPVRAADQPLHPRRRSRRAAAHQRRHRRAHPQDSAAPSTSAARSSRASRRWSRTSTVHGRPTSASASAPSRRSFAGWSRASCRAGSATATASTTSEFGWHPSTATTSARSRGRRSTRRLAPPFAPATS